MSKPIVKVSLTTVDKKKTSVNAVFDTGSFYTLIRQDILPKNTRTLPCPFAENLKAASKGSVVHIVGMTEIVVTIGKKMINTSTLISPNLNSELIIGAKTMQSWDISIKNKNGHTKISVGHDMRDPEITEVL